MKKIINISILLILIVGLTTACANNSKVSDKETSYTNEQNKNDLDNTNSLVLYFSATGNTKRIANMIGDVTGSSVIELIPTDEYTAEDLNYSNDDCRANREQNDDNARPEIKNTIDDIESYDTIYLGYPIWWGDVPKIILTFLDTYDLDGKTIVPFCTSGSSGISTSINTLRNYNSNINVLDGRRFSSSNDESDISNWINELGQ